MVDKVALGQDFLRVLQFSPVNIIPPWLSILIYHMGDEQQAPWWLQFRDIVSCHQHEQQCKESTGISCQVQNHLDEHHAVASGPFAGESSILSSRCVVQSKVRTERAVGNK
jgi:hypothetical protein